MKSQALKLYSRTSLLPDELLLHEILPRLPTKSILRFKCVSKTWLSLIYQHSFLAAKHAGQKPGMIVVELRSPSVYTIKSLFSLSLSESNIVEIDTSYVYQKNPARIHLVGSCNGVVCLKLDYFDETHDLVLWNPATREVNYLPAAASTTECESFYNGYTLGFDPHTAVHKVVWLKQSFTSIRGSLTPRIFSKNNRPRHWRQLNSLSLIHASSMMLRRGLSIDGVIYWISHPLNVLSFDLSKEELREFDGPVSHLDYRLENILHFQLINWKGSLATLLLEPGGAEIEVWLKNKDTNASESGWKKISTIQPFSGPLKLGRVFSTQIVVMFQSDNSGPWKRILYDLFTKEKRDLQEGCLCKLWSLAISEHFDTLISPN